MNTEQTRCSWAVGDLLIRYHDHEYGCISTHDQDIFEKICLESFSAGLSWYLVLRKREALRRTFAGFDVASCALLSDEALARATSDPEIIRNTKKIEAVRTNARVCLSMIEKHGSLAAYIRQYSTPSSLHAAFKKAGIRQFGPVCAEELLKSLGIIEAHEKGCFRHASSVLETAE